MLHIFLCVLKPAQNIEQVLISSDLMESKNLDKNQSLFLSHTTWFSVKSVSFQFPTAQNPQIDADFRQLQYCRLNQTANSGKNMCKSHVFQPLEDSRQQPERPINRFWKQWAKSSGNKFLVLSRSYCSLKESTGNYSSILMMNTS